jgi:hypothetical protein
MGTDTTLYVLMIETTTQDFQNMRYDQKTTVYVSSTTTSTSTSSCGENSLSPCPSLIHVIRYIIKLKQEGIV